LTTPEEALVLEQQIRSETALGADRRVWDLEQDMLTIARKHHDDVRMMPIFRGLAEDRMDALEQYRAGGMPPEISLGCYYARVPRRYDHTRGDLRPLGDGASCHAGSKSVVEAGLRSEIAFYYADAIKVILDGEDYASQDLRDLERRVLRIASFPPFEFLCPPAPLERLLALDLRSSCLAPLIHQDKAVIANVGGFASLLRLIAYEYRSAAPAAVRANAIAELADRHLLSIPAAHPRFDGAVETALELYGHAYRELAQGGDAQRSAQRLFSPEAPVTLPTWLPNPLDSASDSPRYIDVSFAVTKYGTAEHAAIVAASAAATRADERALLRLIERARFRPRFADGELFDPAPVVVRYALDR
jgi:hypothetical protein